MMNAQKRWKIAYHCWKEAKPKFSNYYETNRWASEMTFIRREAALERKLAAAQRTIEALQMQVWQLEAQEHSRDDGNEWEKEYYLRGMHR